MRAECYRNYELVRVRTPSGRTLLNNYLLQNDIIVRPAFKYDDNLGQIV